MPLAHFHSHYIPFRIMIDANGCHDAKYFNKRCLSTIWVSSIVPSMYLCVKHPRAVGRSLAPSDIKVTGC